MATAPSASHAPRERQNSIAASKTRLPRTGHVPPTDAPMTKDAARYTPRKSQFPSVDRNSGSNFSRTSPFAATIRATTIHSWRIRPVDSRGAFAAKKKIAAFPQSRGSNPIPKYECSLNRVETMALAKTARTGTITRCLKGKAGRSIAVSPPSAFLRSLVPPSTALPARIISGNGTEQSYRKWAQDLGSQPNGKVNNGKARTSTKTSSRLLRFHMRRTRVVCSLPMNESIRPDNGRNKKTSPGTKAPRLVR